MPFGERRGVSPTLAAQNQIQQFFLNPIQGFVSGLNVGSQTSEGFEFQMQKGDFSRDGLSGLLSFAYTNSYIRYGPIAAGASGTTVLAPINNSIAQYNAYTKYCATHPSSNPNSRSGWRRTEAIGCLPPTRSASGRGDVAGQGQEQCEASSLLQPCRSWSQTIISRIACHWASAGLPREQVSLKRSIARRHHTLHEDARSG